MSGSNAPLRRGSVGGKVGLAACFSAAALTLLMSGIASAGTFHFNQADVSLGRIMQDSTPSTNLTLARGSNGTGTSNFSYTAGMTGPASRTANGNNAPAAITVTLSNAANGTGSPSTGLKIWTATMTSNLTSGQDGSVNVSATVLANRVVTATTANLGTAIVGGTWTGTSNLSTTGVNTVATDVSVATTGGPVGGISITGGTGTAFHAAADTGTRSLSGSFGTAGNQSNSITLTTTGEGLTGEAPINVGIGYTAVAIDHSNASFSSAGNQDALNINFGTVMQNSVQSLGFNLYNLVALAGFTADLDLDSVIESGDVSNKFSTTLPGIASLNLLTAGSNLAYSVAFDTTSAGLFSATYTLATSDENLSGATAGAPLTINVTGEVIAVPEPATIGFGMVLGAATLLRGRR